MQFAISFLEESGVDVAVEFWLQAITSISEITNDFEVLHFGWAQAFKRSKALFCY